MRVLPIGLMLATVTLTACAPPAPPAAPAPKDAAPAAAVTGDANNGKMLFQQKGCIACHVAPVPGATGTIGPNLTNVGNTSQRPKLADGAANTPEHIKEWIKDPQKLKPGTMMPNLQLSEKEADDLTALLASFK
jgi:cytochrome c1